MIAGLALLGLAWLLPYSRWYGALFYAAAFLTLGVPALIGRYPARHVDVTPAPGAIAWSGPLSDVIRAADVVGASTARVAGGVSLAISLKRRDRTLVFELEDAAAAQRICAALGVGYHGFGSLTWALRPDHAAWTLAFRAGAALLWLLCAALASFKTAGVALQFAMYASQATAVFACLSLLVGPKVTLTNRAVYIDGPKGREAAPYEWLTKIAAHEGGVVLEFQGGARFATSARRAGPFDAGLSSEQVLHLVAQLTSATQRAHGEAPPKDDSEAGVQMLRRGDEPARAWLSRLDATGAMLRAPAGYRGAALEENDLWRAVEDPEADPELRAAAARVLTTAFGPRAAARVRDAAAPIRDDDARERIRIALLPDVQEAADGLEAMEAVAEATSRDEGALAGSTRRIE